MPILLFVKSFSAVFNINNITYNNFIQGLLNLSKNSTEENFEKLTLGTNKFLKSLSLKQKYFSDFKNDLKNISPVNEILLKDVRTQQEFEKGSTFLFNDHTLGVLHKKDSLRDNTPELEEGTHTLEIIEIPLIVPNNIVHTLKHAFLFLNSLIDSTQEELNERPPTTERLPFTRHEVIPYEQGRSLLEGKVMSLMVSKIRLTNILYKISDRCIPDPNFIQPAFENFMLKDEISFHSINSYQIAMATMHNIFSV